MIISVSEAIDKLKKNEVVAIPTETVYGLAAKITSQEALKLIFSTKKRPFFDPLIVHVSSIEQAKSLSSDWNLITKILAEKFWPGPLTLVVPKNQSLVSDLITSGLPNVGLRFPNHKIAIEIINAVGDALAAPSANLFGHTSPSEASHVESEFNSNLPVVDGGSCEIGIESTVLLIQNKNLSILRPGQISQIQIENHLKQNSVDFEWSQKVDKKFSPGHMKHHYMPTKPLIGIQSSFKGDLIPTINQILSKLPESVEGVTLNRPNKVNTVQRLVLPDTPEHAARLLYSELRRLESESSEALVFYFESRHQGPGWEAIMERLQKACSAILES
jgi:L-threonylcarbamoyladenylate synthase